jgi:putative membrane protein
VTRARVALAIVTVFAASCLVHAAISRGAATALRLVLATAVLGLGIELVGVHTGFPFGRYAYSDALGPRLFGVPPIVALAWTMLAWPAALAARRLVRATWARVVVGAWALASADLFLDPQLVALHAWTWADPAPHLPGVPTVPLTNYLGWLLAALVVSAAVQAIAGDGPDGAPIALYLWLWIGWTVAQAVFLGLPASAAWGAAAMGLVAVPLVVRCLR